MTQKELAKVMHKAIGTIQSWEGETSYPNAEALCELCEIFDTDPNTILGWYDEHPHEPAEERLPPEEADLMRNYRACSNQWKHTISMTARAAAGETREEAERTASNENAISKAV